MMIIYKRILTSDRLPNESGMYITNLGVTHFLSGCKRFMNCEPLYWFDGVELPTQEEMETESYLPFTKADTEGQYGEFVEDDSKRFLQGANYILNKIKND